MFKEWDFLIGEIWGLLALAALLGLIAGWLIFGRGQRGISIDEGALNHARAQLRTANTELEECHALHEDKDARISALQLELRDLELQSTGPSSGIEAMAAGFMGGRTSGVNADERPFEFVEDDDFDPEAQADVVEIGARAVPMKPETLTGPRDGAPDDLKKIKGVGQKLEQICNRLGFYHFDQIANWTPAEEAWVDENLEGFQGRVSRDGWIEQAKVLAQGGDTEFSKRVDDGQIYDN